MKSTALPCTRDGANGDDELPNHTNRLIISSVKTLECVSETKFLKKKTFLLSLVELALYVYAYVQESGE